MSTTAVIHRFDAKIDRQADGCWLWTGARQGRGYGYFGRQLAHRWSYEQHVGPIPDDLTIDHLCCNILCVNPEHLELVTRSENARRAHARRTHCKRGHPLSGENVRWRGNNRECRTCQREVHDAGRVR